MLTAENNQTPDDNSNTGPMSTVGGFGNVLKSVQGLQQRLSDFSLDDVTAAEANANTLIHRTASVQQKLIELANLKRNLTAVARTIHQIPETDFDLISPDSLERHPQLHAIVKTSKIIRLHKLLKVAKASAQSVSFDSEVGRLEIGTPLAPTISLTKAEKYPERLSKTVAGAKTLKTGGFVAKSQSSGPRNNRASLLFTDHQHKHRSRFAEACRNRNDPGKAF